jgi:hypothetical protein
MKRIHALGPWQRDNIYHRVFLYNDLALSPDFSAQRLGFVNLSLRRTQLMLVTISWAHFGDEPHAGVMAREA